MSTANPVSGERAQIVGLREIMIVFGIMALVGGLLLLSGYSKSVSLNRSAIGFDGLQLWLSEHDIDARTFYGRSVLDAESVGLRILPLYDTDLENEADRSSGEEVAMAETERDIWSYVVEGKIEALPTLVVLPKWRAGVRMAGALHPKLLISDAGAGRITGQIYGDIGTLTRETETNEVSGRSPDGSAYVLHYRQTLSDSSCTPVIGSRTAILLGRCESDGIEFWVLADPDLMNNHGLSQGANAESVLTWLPTLSGTDGEIVLDLSTGVWVWTDSEDDAAQRSWSDLARFFEYPFTLIWWSLAALGVVTFWRAWRRYGPADDRAYEETGPRASRFVSIDIKARLLRLAGRDEALVSTYVERRLERLADDLLGPHRARGEPGRKQLIAAVTRRVPELGTELDALTGVRAEASDTPESLMRHVARYDDLIERILDGFGRTGRAR